MEGAGDQAVKIAHHWHKAKATATDKRGGAWSVERWGSSDVSDADACAEATREAAASAARIAAAGAWPDQYEYGLAGRPLREEIVTEQRDDAGAVHLAITRNRYGALVLNAARALFIDIDRPNPEPAATPAPGGGLLGRLFGRAPAPAPKPVVPAGPDLSAVQAWAAAHPDWSLRAYATKAGLRLLVTHRPFTSDDPHALAAMTELEADPLYVKLCRAQQCYRARLTPKPWRVAILQRPPPFPHGNARLMAGWKLQYDAACRAHATCRMLAALGPGEVHPEIAPVIALHDQATRADSGLPLA